MTFVLIVSRTKMGSGICVGGFTLDSYENVRLLPLSGQHSHPASTPFRIGQIWDMDLKQPAEITPPHVEDMLVRHAKPAGVEPDIAGFLGERAPAVSGDVSALFEGLLRVSNSGTAYIGHEAVPRSSVGFWRPSSDLHLEDGPRPQYRAPARNRDVAIRFVGDQDATSSIPSGALVRLSLARWFAPGGDSFEACWLQLSGWYPKVR